MLETERQVRIKRLQRILGSFALPWHSPRYDDYWGMSLRHHIEISMTVAKGVMVCIDQQRLIIIKIK
jgi:hypothetical protein